MAEIYQLPENGNANGNATIPFSIPIGFGGYIYVKETLCDPDGDPTNVLACFEAKMCNAGVPIYWERML